MALRGKASTAHIYDKNNACLFCHMYKNNVEMLNHVCTPQREANCDKRALTYLASQVKQAVENGK